MRKGKKTLTIGFVGQGFVGKNIADDFENRGYETARYSLEKKYVGNKAKVGMCDIVFIAVPTPTTPKGFDYSLLKEVIALVGKGKTAVIKSTILPGTTEKLQEMYPDKFIFFSPEFLSEATAPYDAAHPFLALVGTPVDSTEHLRRASEVLGTLPQCPHMHVVRAKEAELVKYGHNCSGYVQIVFFNLLFDLAQKLGADWARVQSALEADPYIPSRYARPVHKSGRGAGGNCFIKDFAALRQSFETIVGDELGGAVFDALEAKNIALLQESGKDPHLLQGVYGKALKKATRTKRRR